VCATIDRRKAFSMSDAEAFVIGAMLAWGPSLVLLASVVLAGLLRRPVHDE